MANADLTRNGALAAVLLVVGMAIGYWVRGPLGLALAVLAVVLNALVFYLGTNRNIDTARSALYGARTSLISPAIPLVFEFWRTTRMQATMSAAHRDAVALAILLTALWSLVVMLRLGVRRSRGVATSIVLVIIAALLA